MMMRMAKKFSGIFKNKSKETMKSNHLTHTVQKMEILVIWKLVMIQLKKKRNTLPIVENKKIMRRIKESKRIEKKR